MPTRLFSVNETAERIRAGDRLLLAGDEALLSQLPAGDWIAGTIPYFMAPQGGCVTRDLIYVDELPEQVTDVKVATYGPDDLVNIAADGFGNGFTIVILPATSEVHARYAAEAPEFPHLFDRPVVGWVSGVHLDDLGSVSPRVFAGSGDAGSDSVAVVLHAELPDGVLASADIVNLFTQGDGATLTFDGTGFAQGKVNVDGVPCVFADYLREIGHDTRLPLVADYFGAMVNVSFQAVPDGDEPVALYAPVFEGVEYKLAAPVGDYVSEFVSQLPVGSTAPAFSCNCILNFLYSELEGKKTGDIGGPITFGEVAYQLLNQTLVYLTIHE
ncbi:MAG: hypothetical protein WBV06_05970 [Acidimicrobiia bacterium]|jgi:hypothetical protein